MEQTGATGRIKKTVSSIDLDKLIPYRFLLQAGKDPLHPADRTILPEYEEVLWHGLLGPDGISGSGRQLNYQIVCLPGTFFMDQVSTLVSHDYMQELGGQSFTKANPGWEEGPILPLWTEHCQKMHAGKFSYQHLARY